eukprot:jgi/Botrbrau1/10789/Bobra.0119s0015.1
MGRRTDGYIKRSADEWPSNESHGVAKLHGEPPGRDRQLARKQRRNHVQPAVGNVDPGFTGEEGSRHTEAKQLIRKPKRKKKSKAPDHDLASSSPAATLPPSLQQPNNGGAPPASNGSRSTIASRGRKDLTGWKEPQQPFPATRPHQQRSNGPCADPQGVARDVHQPASNDRHHDSSDGSPGRARSFSLARKKPRLVDVPYKSAPAAKLHIPQGAPTAQADTIGGILRSEEGQADGCSAAKPSNGTREMSNGTAKPPNGAAKSSNGAAAVSQENGGAKRRKTMAGRPAQGEEANGGAAGWLRCSDREADGPNDAHAPPTPLLDHKTNLPTRNSILATQNGGGGDGVDVHTSGEEAVVPKKRKKKKRKKKKLWSVEDCPAKAGGRESGADVGETSVVPQEGAEVSESPPRQPPAPAKPQLREEYAADAQTVTGKSSQVTGKKRKVKDVEGIGAHSSATREGQRGSDAQQMAAAKRHTRSLVSQLPKRTDLLQQRKQLPVWAARERILEVVKGRRALVLVGETGSGKTTQIPQFLLEAGLAGQGMIAVTQPRRVAALNVARRVALERQVPLGSEVPSHPADLISSLPPSQTLHLSAAILTVLIIFTTGTAAATTRTIVIRLPSIILLLI